MSETEQHSTAEMAEANVALIALFDGVEARPAADTSRRRLLEAQLRQAPSPADADL